MIRRERIFTRVIYYASVVSIVVLVVSTAAEAAASPEGFAARIAALSHGGRVALGGLSALGVYIFALSPLAALGVVAAMSIRRKDYPVAVLSLLLLVLILMALLGFVKIAE